MRELILHHRYSLGIPWDTSGFHNHGVARSAWADSGAIRFKNPSSRIDVPPSGSLKDLGAYRCSISFRLEGTNANARYNLVESHLSFALYTIPGFALMATILDGTGSWNGVQTGSLPLNDGQWHRADCGHDGLSTLWLAFDGKVAAVRQDVPGPVRPLGYNGLTIGHWPEPVDKYTFDGSISQVWLWRERPEPPLDDCCIDEDALAAAAAHLRRLGYDRNKLLALMLELQRIVALLYTQLALPVREDIDRTAAKMNIAFRSGQYALFAQHALHMYQVLVAALGASGLDAAVNAVTALLGPLANDRRLRAHLTGFLCGVPREPPGDPERRERDPLTSDPSAGDEPGYPPRPRPDGWSDPK